MRCGSSLCLGRFRRLFIAISIYAVWSTALGQEAGAQCAVPAEDIERSQYFEGLQVKALELDQASCFALGERFSGEFDQNQNARYLAFGMEARSVASTAFDGLPVNDIDFAFDRFIEQVSIGEFSRKQLPELRVELSDLDDEWLIFHFDDAVRFGSISQSSDNRACIARFGATCADLLQDLALAINYYKYSYESLTAADAVNTLNSLSGRWDDFLETGRSQTLLDVSLTSLLERRHLRRGFLVGPPKRQWSLLHPGLVYEYASDAPAGERDKLTAVVEWVGVNWWGEDSPLFDIPFGISLASVYADRPGMNSVGHGLLFHFDNRYSVGWSNRDGDDSFYFSMDLLGLVDDKRKRARRYRSKLTRDYRALFSSRD